MLLTTKLYRPPLHSGVIQRERLDHALDQGWAEGARLLLLSAPPGYGKTTLLSGWVEARRIPCAWVSLDGDDNDPARFFLLLLRALEAHFPGLEDLLPILNLPTPPDFESLAGEIINRTAQSGPPALLVLDDYHVIVSSSVHGLVQMLLNHLSPQLRLAVLTREDPPFNLPQMRVRRQLLEIRARELTFSAPEGYHLMVDTQGLPLDADQVGALLDRTEGWAAGLQLAALTLRDHAQPTQFIESFSGAHHFVLDYLVGEVLEKLPAETRSFLCRSAVLDRFNAELCDTALELKNSRALIAQAAASNLFLVPLDEQHTWFRYHHLMADILKAEVSADERQAISRRAAAWLKEHRRPLEAVRSALEGGDYELASAIIQEAAVPAAENGMLTTALGWLDALPQEVLLAHPDLCVYRAWFLLFNGRFQEAATWLQQLTAMAPHLPPPLVGLLSGIQGWMRTVSAQKLDLAQLQEAYAITEGKYPYFSPLLLLAIGQAQREAGDWAGALASYTEGASLAETSSGPVSALILRNNQAFLLNDVGERQAAQRLCLDGIEDHSAPDGKPGLLAGIPLLPYGCFLYESGRLDEAYSKLTQGINLVRRLGLYDILTAPANYNLQHLLVDQGRLEEALALNTAMHRRALKAGLKVVAQEAELMAALLQSIAGNPAPAARWAEANPLPENPHHYTIVVLHARVLSAAGKTEPALALLLPVLEGLASAGLKASWVRVSVETALVYLAAGQSQKAAEVLAPAVESAALMDYRQVFRRYHALLAPVLERLQPRFPQFIQSLGPLEAADRPAHPSLIEQPSQRELEILRLVGAGLSNADIAGRLYITEGTVKWHLNHLFAKLGVARRTEAVAKARDLGLF